MFYVIASIVLALTLGGGAYVASDSELREDVSSRIESVFEADADVETSTDADGSVEEKGFFGLDFWNEDEESTSSVESDVDVDADVNAEMDASSKAGVGSGAEGSADAEVDVNADGKVDLSI